MWRFFFILSCNGVFFLFNITVNINEVIQKIESFAHSGMAHDTCVDECKKLVGGVGAFFCDTGCTTYAYIVNVLK